MNTMTKPQAKFLRDLQEERELGTRELTYLEALRGSYKMGVATKKMASDTISVLLSAPKRSVFSPGIYELNGTLYRVYLGQNSGQMLCKAVDRLPDGDVVYTYVGTAGVHLRGDVRRLTREEVAERTLAYGSTSCMVCGRRLDDPESVDRGIGPVCWENYS